MSPHELETGSSNPRQAFGPLQWLMPHRVFRDPPVFRCKSGALTSTSIMVVLGGIGMEVAYACGVLLALRRLRCFLMLDVLSLGGVLCYCCCSSYMSVAPLILAVCELWCQIGTSFCFRRRGKEEQTQQSHSSSKQEHGTTNHRKTLRDEVVPSSLHSSLRNCAFGYLSASVLKPPLL